MPAPKAVRRLVERFAANQAEYSLAAYKEASLRVEFLDPLFIELGWDVGNSAGRSEANKSVVVEPYVDAGGRATAPDYAFRVGGDTAFYAEAKKPSENIHANAKHAFQLRSYSWTSKLPVGLLTDFQEFAIYDGRTRPKESDDTRKSRIDYFTFDKLDEKWDLLEGLFGRKAVEEGSLSAYVAKRQADGGQEEVDDVFLADMESWRALLARDFYRQNKSITEEQLNFAVQVTLDRLLFLRMCEDRRSEEYGLLREAVKGADAYQEILRIWQLADDKYNSGLFHFRQEKGRAEKPDSITPNLKLDTKTLRQIVGGLYPPASPYAFRVMPPDILGQVYERFLGSTIKIDGRGVRVEEKPEVRKAGGVYYTPTFVVRHIVWQTVGELLATSTISKAEALRILDPACGSGSFLVAVLDFLCTWYLERFTAGGPARYAKGKRPMVRLVAGTGYVLSLWAKKEILRRHIFGVDVDAQAVEVTKLSLLLRVMEGETDAQVRLLDERALPDLSDNIKVGDSLIEADYWSASQGELAGLSQRAPANAFTWAEEFPKVDAEGGFDVVVGNPPYVLLQDEFRIQDHLDYFKAKYVAAAFKIDTYHLFMERGLKLVRPGGRFGMITPSNFLANNHLAGLRRMVLQEATINELLVIDKGVFKGVSVDNAITVATRRAKGSRNQKAFSIQRVSVHAKAFTPGAVEVVNVEDAIKSPDALFTGSATPELDVVLKKVSASSVELGTLALVNFGKQLRDRKKFTKDVIDVPTEAAIPKGYQACYRGEDARRYSVVWGGTACLKDRAAKRGGCWDDERQGANPKLLTRQIGRFPQFGMDQAGFHSLNALFMVSPMSEDVDAWFLLGWLNSKIVRAFWLERFSDRRQTFPKIKGGYLERLPVPAKRDKALTSQIGARARELTSAVKALNESSVPAKHAQAQRRVTALETEIETLCGTLAGLSAKELAEIAKVTG